MTDPIYAFTSTQPNDEQLVGNSGTPILAQKTLLPGGGSGAAPIIQVPRINPDLEGIPSGSYAGLSSGAIASVTSVGAYWALDLAGGLPVDGITVVNATNGPPGSQWVRVDTFVQEQSTQQTLWTVNPTSGSDENPGTALLPLKTIAEIARRMGVAGDSPWRPTLDVDVVVNMTDPAGTPVADPWDFYPIGSGSLLLDSSGAETLIFTGTIAGLVAENRTTGQPWQMTAYAGAAVGQLLVNSTRGNSVAFVLEVGGGLVTFAQPVTPSTNNPTATPTNVDTWANGDAITASTLAPVNVSACGFQYTDITGARFTHVIYRTQIKGLTGSQALLWDGSTIVECSYLSAFVFQPGANFAGIALYETSFAGSILWITSGGDIPGGTSAWFGGGIWSAAIAGFAFKNGVTFANNAQIAAASIVDVQVLSGVTLFFITSPSQQPTDASGFLWGQGRVDNDGTTFRYNAPAATNFTVAAILLDNVSTGMVPTSSAGVVTWNGPRNLTAALLDTAAGAGGFTDATVFGTSCAYATSTRSTYTTLSI